jgi:hypothetical protein
MQRDNELLDWWTRRSRHEQIIHNVTRRQPEAWMRWTTMFGAGHRKRTATSSHATPTLGLGGSAARLALERYLSRRLPT